MPPSPKVERIYDVTDNTMFERVATIQDLFAEDLADFTAFDPEFDETFHSNWVADLEAAQALATDETVQDESAALTEAVNTAMAAGRDKWVEVKYFMEKGFPNSKAKQNEFGADDYRKVSVVQKDFIQFLDNLHTKAEKYKVELIAKHYTQPQIDEIETLRDNLFAANKAQEDWKKSRLTATEDRRVALNKVYTTVVQVNKAAQVIFRDSYAKRSQYVFDPNGDGAGVDGPGDYTGTVGVDERKEVAHINYRADRVLTFQNTGDAVLQFYLTGGSLLPGDAVIVTLVSGGTQSHPMSDLDASANHIIVHNASGDACTYKVTVGA